ncbi:hypothetical protein GCM10010520_66240 [Rhizobium viscosum]|uniref:Uncharacterized protein n=1 Tax=Rhizobium viscosum TaxID=1673 RepID=A0ABR9ITP0_RHIVS|nr:hypothetical protein [Rhizobium viscosum]MBE1506556.1 hypothetical protein [Rhizobium viscosum]
MPTVPTYQDTQQHVALRPEYTEGFTVQADAEAFGSAIGKGMQGLATGMGTLGEAVVEVEKLDNANAAKDAQTKLNDWQRDGLYGKSGFLTLTGRAAVEGRAAFEKLAEQKRAEFGKSLTPGAARIYEETSRASMNTLLDSTIRHTFDQRKAWFAETSANSIKSAGAGAVAVYSDPAKVDAEIGKGVAEIEHQGHMQGWSRERLDQERARFVSDTTKNVALGIANDSAIKAEQYVKDAGDRMLSADSTALLKSLQPAVTEEKARQNTTDIIAGLPPTYTGAPDANAAPTAATPNADSGTGGQPQTGGPVQPSTAGARTTGLETDGAGSGTGGARTLGAPRSAGKTAAPQIARSQTTGQQPAGPQVSTTQTPPRQPSGLEDFRTVAATLTFPGKAKDDLAVASFVRNAAGTTVAPSLQPWLTDVTGAILGTAPAGSTAADATSFRHFGLPTQTPRPGDIVVLGPPQSKGAGRNGGNAPDDREKGQIGIFRGYDADGNILVLGRDPRRAGETALTAHAASQVIGFRTSGTVDEKTMTLPNYNPESLRRIEESLNSIADPALRAATEAQLNGYTVSLKKAIDAQRVQVQEWANNEVIADPTFDPTKLPVHIQQAIGPSGMLALRDYKEKVRAYGQPATDTQTLYDLQTEFARDPAAFSQIDLLGYRSKLSDKDWEKVTGWRQMALTDQRKARLESLDINSAFELAKPQLESLGFFAQDGGFATSYSVPHRVAEFRLALLDQMDVFKDKNDGQNPTQSDIQKMINRLLFPIVISSPGSFVTGWTPTKKQGYLYQANALADDQSYDIAVEYEDIPRDLRQSIEADLTKKNRRKPSQDEIVSEYETSILNR